MKKKYEELVKNLTEKYHERQKEFITGSFPTPLRARAGGAGEIHEKIIFKDKNYALKGVIFEVYRKMGLGF